MVDFRTIRISDFGRVVTGKTPPSAQPELLATFTSSSRRLTLTGSHATLIQTGCFPPLVVITSAGSCCHRVQFALSALARPLARSA
jgi:hypothetical protein